MSLHTSPIPTLVVLLGLVSLSAFFSSSETAIFTLPESWVTDQDSAGDSRVETLQALRTDPHRLLVTILVGNNVVNVAIASLTTVLLIDYLPQGSAVTVATLVTSVVVLIFGEIVPKAYGLGQAERWALVVAGPLTLIERVLSPLVSVFDVITRWLNARIGGESDIEQPYVDD